MAKANRTLKSAILIMLTLPLAGCSTWAPPIDWGFYEEPQAPATEEEKSTETVEEHNFYLSGEDSVIGRLASVPVNDGDTLLDIARQYSMGYQHIVDTNPGVDPWVPDAGTRALLPLQFILPDARRQGIVINVAAMRLFYFKPGKPPKLSTWPLGIGKEGRSTPIGAMAIARKMKHPTWYVPSSIRRDHQLQGDPLPAVVPPGPDNPLGDYALYLSKPSYLIHGTNKPYSIGLRASNGCIRLYPEDIEKAYGQIPIGTPVRVVNQPYLLGWLNGVLYLEAHRPYEEINSTLEKQNLFAKLHQIEEKKKSKLDWAKIEQTVKQSRGIPIPIFEHTESVREVIADAAELEHPDQLLGQPEPVHEEKDGWLLFTQETDDEFGEKRLAAMLNHLGPRIPARVVKLGKRRYRVVAGPFASAREAQKAQIALRTDFNTQSEIANPVKLAEKQPVATAKPEAKLKPIEAKQVKKPEAKPPERKLPRLIFKTTTPSKTSLRK